MLRKLLLFIAILPIFVVESSAQIIVVDPYADENEKTDLRGFIVRVGETAPDFTIRYPDDRPSIKLSDLRGSVVMLQFTASWCGVCKKEMPHIEKEIWQVYKDKGLKLFGVDLREKKQRVIDFQKQIKVTYPLILDEKSEIFNKYADKNAGVTRNILIDRDGKIIFMTRLYHRDEFLELIDKIDEALK